MFALGKPMSWMLAWMLPAGAALAGLSGVTQLGQLEAQSFPATRADDESEGKHTGDGLDFIHDHDGVVYQYWGKENIYEAVIKIDRYYGDKKQIAQQIKSGMMEPNAILRLPNYDCDITTDSGVKGVVPEYDQLYINGHFIERLTGADRKMEEAQFSIPIEYLNLPRWAGDVAENHIMIDVDTGNKPDYDIWLLGQYYQSLTIKAALPVMMVHGWTENSASMQTIRRYCENSLGLPCEWPDVSFSDTPVANARFLDGQVRKMINSYRAPKINIIAHSKGGLDSRVLVDTAGRGCRFVQNVLQIATPNGGSRLADVVANPRNWAERRLAGIAPSFSPIATADNRALQSLRLESCRLLNERFRNPLAQVHTLIGRMRNRRGSSYYYSGRVCYGHDDTVDDRNKNGDGIVTVASADAIGTMMAASPLRESAAFPKLDHSAIVNGGAPRVMALLNQRLRELPEASELEHEIGHEIPALRGTPSAEDAEGEGMGDDAAEGRGAWIDELVPNYESPEEHASASRDVSYSGIPVEPGKSVCTPIGLLKAGGGEICVFGLPQDAIATLLAPNGDQFVKLTYVPIDALGLEMHVAELPEECPDGIYQLRYDIPASTIGLKYAAGKEHDDDQEGNGSRYFACPVLTNTGTLLELRIEEAGGSLAHKAIVIRARLAGTEGMAMDPPPEFELQLYREGSEGAVDFTAPAAKIAMRPVQDGWYEAQHAPDEDGRYQAYVYMNGTFNGIRQQMHCSLIVTSCDRTAENCGIELGAPEFEVAIDPARRIATALNATISTPVTRPGRYLLTGDLYSPDGRKVTRQTSIIEVGDDDLGALRKFRLEFKAAPLYKCGEDGCYTLRNLELKYDSGDNAVFATILRDGSQHPTPELNADAFAPQPLQVVRLNRDYMEELSAEEQPAYEYLAVEFDVMVAPGCAGTYNAYATLLDQDRNPICRSLPCQVILKDCIEAGGVQTVKIRFDGTKIREFGADGVYYIRSLFFENHDELSKGIRTTPSTGGPEYRLHGTYKARDFTFSTIPMENTLCRWDNLEIIEQNGSRRRVRLTCHYVPFRRTKETKFHFQTTFPDEITGTTPEELGQWYADPEKMYIALGVYMYDCYMFPPLSARYDSKIDSGITVLTSAAELTGQLTSQLRSIGNRDDVLDLGETITFDLLVQCEDGFDFSKWTPLVTISGHGMYPFVRNYSPLESLAMCHIVDSNRDFEVDRGEAANALGHWRSGLLSNRVLLEAIDLAEEGPYHYESRLNRFLAGRSYSLQSIYRPTP